jgi:hypothetical protein
MAKQWQGDKLACDLCTQTGVRLDTEHFVDGKTKMGAWAIMCDAHFHRFGVGVGPGQGQRYDAKTGEQVEG